MADRSRTNAMESPVEIDLPTATVCHLFLEGSGVSYCGVPRSEQQLHGYPSDHWFHETYCSACGLPRCPRCATEGI